MDGIRKREKLQAEGNSFRFVVCWLFVRVFCPSIRLEQTEHRAVNLLKEVESVNASERESERARREVCGKEARIKRSGKPCETTRKYCENGN